MRWTMLAGILIAVILIGAGAGYFFGTNDSNQNSSSGRTITQTTTTTLTRVITNGGSTASSLTTSTSTTVWNYSIVRTNQTLGIQLALYYQTNQTSVGVELPNEILVRNLLDKDNNLTVGRVDPYGGCDTSSWDFSLYQGWLDASQVQNATQVGFAISCPPVSNETMIAISEYGFQSNSTTDFVYGYNMNNSPVSYGPNMESSSYSVYFVTGLGSPLPAGQYTLYIFDRWNQTILWQFAVVK
jgi:hypothetical protein